LIDYYSPSVSEYILIYFDAILGVFSSSCMLLKAKFLMSGVVLNSEKLSGLMMEVACY
jgi:hypothetical protein